jgi:hypothetical protein
VAAIVLSLVIYPWGLQYGNPWTFFIGLGLLIVGSGYLSYLVLFWATRKLAKSIKDSWKEEIKNVQDSDERKI